VPESTWACDEHAPLHAISGLSDAELTRRLDVMPSCATGPGLPLEGMFLTFSRLQDYLQAPGSPAARAEHALRVGRTAQTFDRGTLVGAMVGVALELEAIEVLESLGPDLGPRQREQLRAEARDLRHGPTPDLALDGQEMTAAMEAHWQTAPLAGWCADGVETARAELLPILGLSGEARAAALEDWTTARTAPWTPWGRIGFRCTVGMGEVLQSWHDDRERADAGWSRIAQMRESI
jgi:hypothetical protein